MVILMTSLSILKERSNKYNNMEYFPLILKQRVKLVTRKDATDIESVIKQVKSMVEDKYCYEPHLVCCGDYLDDNCMYEYCINPRLRNIVDWVMHNIILINIGWETMEVRKRIAVCMLDKIDMITSSDNLRIFITDNIVKNVGDVFRQKTLDLPF